MSAPAPARALRPAVFLDRDGTIVADPGYLRDPDLVELLPGAGRAIARLNRGGLAVVVVTNQAGISRGRLTEPDYRAVATRLEQRLASEGAQIDAAYFCPHAPETDGPCECRKPGLLLFRRAAEEHSLDLGASWWVGDRLSDLLPAAAWGGNGVLVETGEGLAHREVALGQGFPVVPSLDAAVDRIFSQGDLVPA